MIKYLHFIEEFYKLLSLSLAIFIILEIAWPDLILAYININLVLIFWLIIGIIFIAIKPRK